EDVDAKRQPAQDIIDELDGGALVAGVEDFEHANPRAIVDRRELIEPAATARDSLEELHVQLEPMTGLRLFIALPAFAVRTMILIRMYTFHLVSPEHASDG